MPRTDTRTLSRCLLVESCTGEIDTAPWAAYRKEIKKIVIGDNITQIGTDNFSECPLLETVKLGKNVKKIKRGAFASSPKLKKVNLGDKLVTIEANAFDACVSLEEVYVGKNLKEISDWAFTGCAELKKITVNSKNKYFTMQENGLLNKKKTKWVLGSLKPMWPL